MQASGTSHPVRELQRAATASDRLVPMILLSDLSPAGLLHDSARSFDGGVRFGPAVLAKDAPCPARWLGQSIERAVAAAVAGDSKARPLHIFAPAPALAHVATLSACLRAVSIRALCPPELCLTFSNAAISADLPAALAGLRRLREAGFRLGIDARQSSCALAHPAVRLLVETAHVDARALSSDTPLMKRTKRSGADGMGIVAHRAAWRDRDEMIGHGVSAVVAARPDA